MVSKPQRGEFLVSRDEIETVLENSGAHTPELARLARLVADMQRMEFELARRKGKKTDYPGHNADPA